MTNVFNPTNSIWPNGIKVDSDGYGIFYPLGTNKVDVPTESSAWPDGDTLISPFVYKNGSLVGFCDTKAMIASSSFTTMPYNHIEVNFSSINEGDLEVNAPNAKVKIIKWATSKDTSNSGDTIVLGTKFLGCRTIDEIKAVDANYKTNDIIDGVWTQSLADLELSAKHNGDYFEYGTAMFHGCSNLVSFTSDLKSLDDGYYMFYSCSNLTSFDADLSSLTKGNWMFDYCSNLGSFASDLSSLVDGYYMFSNCSKLSSFNGDLSSLKNGDYMFHFCTSLSSFKSNLSSLTNALWMFNRTKLDTQSVQNIADTIKDITDLTSSDGCSCDETLGAIAIDIANTTPNTEENTAFRQMVDKGWKVYVNGNGNASDPYQPTNIVTLDENGEEISTPIPFYAKPLQSDEARAMYVDSEGNYFNILGGQFIYGDDLSTYGMFTCEADAAANMRLTKIERNK